MKTSKMVEEKNKEMVKRLLMASIAAVWLSSCEIEPNNYQVVDMNFRFDTAYIDLGDEVIKVKVKSWTDFDEGVQVQVTAEDGKVYLASQSDCVLVYEKEN